MSESPIDQVLGAVDRLDAEAAVSLLAPDAQFLAADGRRAHGVEAARALLEEFVAKLRSCSHTVTAQWHVDDVWIAEVDASYELRDHLEIGPLPRAVFVRQASDGISDVRIYGAHEHPLAEHRTGGEGLWIGGRWVPPL